MHLPLPFSRVIGSSPVNCVNSAVNDVFTLITQIVRSDKVLSIAKVLYDRLQVSARYKRVVDRVRARIFSRKVVSRTRT